MGDDNKKKKVAIAGLASILLVAMVVAVAVSVPKDEEAAPSDANGGGGGGISSSTKAASAICSPTDYKDTCEQSIKGANSTDPKELIKTAFQYTVKNIQNTVSNSPLFKQAATDERVKGAMQVCKEVLNTSVEDLQRSFDKVGDFDVSKVDDYIDDVKTWLSGAITYQETCLDAFENTTGDTGEKMKKLLKVSGQLLSNGLAMVNDFSEILSSLGGLSSRRLLSYEGGANVTPSFVDARARKLMAATPATLKPNAVVAQDGSGQYKTITEVINTFPKKSNETFVIYVKAGTYKETVIIPRHVNNVVLIGDGPLKTRIVGSKSFAGGVQTYHTAVLAVNSDGFLAKDIGIENTAGPDGHQAVAVRVSGDKAIFYNVHMDGYQDTLYAHSYRQFYRDCLVSGTIDFIFGDAVAVFQRCRLVVRKPNDDQACMITAQGRKDHRSVGITVLQDCDIVAEPGFLEMKPMPEAFLGRPWKEYSRTIVMQSNIDGFISPKGWSPWMGTFALDTLYYGEYQNRGPGSDLSQRVKWKGIKKITPELAQSFTPGMLYRDDAWVRTSGIPYVSGMMKV